MSDTPNVFADEWDDPFPPTEGWRSHIKRVVPPGQGLGMSVWELEGGQTQVPYHFHHGADELILVLSGRPTLRTPEGEHELEREERRLERLRLVTQLWPPADRFDDPDPGPDQAA